MRRLARAGVIAAAIAMTPVVSSSTAVAAQSSTTQADAQWIYHIYDDQGVCNWGRWFYHQAGYQTDPAPPEDCYDGGANYWYFWHYEP
ncbi:hypothetical protein [Nonomuraea sp. NPDC005650]|uniref:hypothetical protein n=1 Tax=Nonomuraea sp. NPDC005650 TaxID=3157045 RepID=UPI0033B8D794